MIQKELADQIKKKLKNIPEQMNVVGPLIVQLVKAGWELDQIIAAVNT